MADERPGWRQWVSTLFEIAGQWLYVALVVILALAVIGAFVGSD